MTDEEGGPEEDPVAEEPETDTGPVDPDERIVSLDVLRGFALLGILIINIRLFAMPRITLSNPTVFGDFTGMNYWAWFVGHVFAEQKFITLFTLLFGAGILLFVSSKERSGAPAMKLHVRRNVLLVIIGLAHAYLLWYGDILVAYGLCALFVVVARDWEPKIQAGIGVAVFAVPSLLELSLGLSGATPPELAELWSPTQEVLQSEVDAYQGGWLDQMDHRLETAVEAQTIGFLNLVMWRVAGIMLLGMALFKWGVLTNDRSTAFYRRLVLGGGVGGLALILTGVWHAEANDWAAEAVPLISSQFNYWGSVLLALAYIGVVMLFCRSRADGIVGTALAAVGKTAFTNYLLQTVLATTIFYGHGLGLFGQVSRVEQLGIVLLIWAIQIPLSVLWLRYFRFGPVEWVWRTLTYGERQPLWR